MSPSFDLGLTSQRDHEYLQAQLNIATFSMVAWIFMVNVQGSYPLFLTPDVEVWSKTGFGEPTYSINTSNQSSDNVKARNDDWNLVIFSIEEWPSAHTHYSFTINKNQQGIVTVPREPPLT